MHKNSTEILEPTCPSVVGVEALLHHCVSHALHEVREVRYKVQKSVFVARMNNSALNVIEGGAYPQDVPHRSVPGRTITANVIHVEAGLLTQNCSFYQKFCQQPGFYVPAG